jgi:acyl-coenzyme A thioesterase PaaI-like protein
MAQDEHSPAAGIIDDRPTALRFGEEPLAQTREASAALRRLAGLLVSLEHEHPTVDAMIGQLASWEDELTLAAPRDPRPRFGPEQTAEQRVYLDHAFDPGSFNPNFPEYRFERIESESARGTVTFPVVYEGPPGLVHGGVIASFFDCVIQHHNCAMGSAGKTRSLTITYRRPTPLLTDLDFDITREVTDRGLRSAGRLVRDGQVLCTGELDSVAMSTEQLAARAFGRRRGDDR